MDNLDDLLLAETLEQTSGTREDRPGRRPRPQQNAAAVEGWGFGKADPAVAPIQAGGLSKTTFFWSGSFGIDVVSSHRSRRRSL